jgi:hypothetical protein
VASLDAALLVLMELANAAGRWMMMANWKNDPTSKRQDYSDYDIGPATNLKITSHSPIMSVLLYLYFRPITYVTPFFLLCGFNLARTVI